MFSAPEAPPGYTSPVDLTLDRPVAIKLLDAGAADEAVRTRFLQEAQAAAKFTHPHAVRVYDTGEDNGTLYLVMELVDGPSLATLLRRDGPLPAAQAVAIADQILAAVSAGHDAGLVHRDIKPSNILFTRDGNAKLADFGIAKGVGSLGIPLTATGQVIGTPQYLSPEQAAGKSATPRSDLYAVGVVLFEMLTGDPPFAADTALATALAHQQAPIPRLADRRPDLDNDLAAVVERALAKSPADRHPDAAAMRDALASPPPAPPRSADGGALPRLATQPLHLQPTPPADGRPGRARRSLVVASVALLAIAALAGVAFTQGDDRDTRSGRPPSTTAPTATSSTSAPPTSSTTLPTTTTATAATPAPGGGRPPEARDEDPPGHARGDGPPPQARDGGPPAHASDEGPPAHTRRENAGN